MPITTPKLNIYYKKDIKEDYLNELKYIENITLIKSVTISSVFFLIKKKKILRLFTQKFKAMEIKAFNISLNLFNIRK